MNWLRNRNRITGKVLAGMVRRIEGAYRILERNENEPVILQRNSNSALFDVRSTEREDKSYEVDLEIKTCTCPDFSFRSVKCKHIIAAEFAVGKLN